MSFVDHYPYWICVALMMSGFYVVMSTSNLVKKLIGLSLFQTAVLLLYVSAGKVSGGIPPIEDAEATAAVVYSNPLPHVLMLTAIVVGVATLAVGLAIVVRIRGSYGTIEEDEIIAKDSAATQAAMESSAEEASRADD